LTIYHGVSVLSDAPRELCYSAGVLILAKDAPHVIRYRSAEPVLAPELRLERQGVVANVVFPTAIDRRDDLGRPDRIDVYYGMADARIGVAKLIVPDVLPGEARADARKATV
jgi:beta-1,2-mannobiose phosphorylase / 1,2-beta-oligomannan phosphorylase